MREKGHAEGAEREKERERERIPNRICTVSMQPDEGLEPMKGEIMISAKSRVKHGMDISHPGAQIISYS